MLHALGLTYCKFLSADSLDHEPDRFVHVYWLNLDIRILFFKNPKDFISKCLPTLVLVEIKNDRFELIESVENTSRLRSRYMNSIARGVQGYFYLCFVECKFCANAELSENGTEMPW